MIRARAATVAAARAPAREALPPSTFTRGVGDVAAPVIDVVSAPSAPPSLRSIGQLGKGAGGTGGAGVRELGTDSQDASDQATAWGMAVWYLGQLAETGQAAAGAAHPSPSEARLANRFSALESAPTVARLMNLGSAASQVFHAFAQNRVPHPRAA